MSQNQRGLLIRHNGANWRSPQIQTYSDERSLQVMLRDSPQLLTLCSVGTVFVGELTVPLVGSVDLAGVGPQGDITLIECKLESNPEIRRSIVGQILAYAAGLWKMPYADFDRYFSARLGGVSLDEAVRHALPESSASDWGLEQFRLNVTDNLAAGRFTLVIAVDRITDELKRVVPYVNSHTVADVKFMALEIGYVRDGGVEIIWPLTYGQESATEKQVAPRRLWSVEAYHDRLKEFGANVVDFMQAITDFSTERGARLEGGTGGTPSLNSRFRLGNATRTVWSSYFQSSGPSFDVNFDYLRGIVSPEAMEACASLIRSISGVPTTYARNKADFRERPSLPIDPILTQQGAAKVVKGALSALLGVS